MDSPAPPNAAPWPDGHEPSPFQAAVIDAVRSVRRGELVSYGDLADEFRRIHPASG